MRARKRVGCALAMMISAAGAEEMVATSSTPSRDFWLWYEEFADEEGEILDPLSYHEWQADLGQPSAAEPLTTQSATEKKTQQRSANNGDREQNR